MTECIRGEGGYPMIYRQFCAYPTGDPRGSGGGVNPQTLSSAVASSLLKTSARVNRLLHAKITFINLHCV